MRSTQEVEQEIAGADRNIKIAEATIKDYEKKIEAERRMIIHYRGWQTALKWMLEK